MLRFGNIYSLSEFRHNTKDFVAKMKGSGAPIVLTVNGRADIIVWDVNAFQDLLDELEHTKEELAKLKAEKNP
jgi:PHD/YefM family antitoxin component YafN of YafNO toxin-antitoxin module